MVAPVLESKERTLFALLHTAALRALYLYSQAHASQPPSALRMRLGCRRCATRQGTGGKWKAQEMEPHAPLRNVCPIMHAQPDGKALGIRGAACVQGGTVAVTKLRGWRGARLDALNLNAGVVDQPARELCALRIAQPHRILHRRTRAGQRNLLLLWVVTTHYI